jgi:hypothetical protein
MTTFVFNMIVILIVGWVVFALDCQFGKNWYRKWYNISHEKPLSADRDRGFIFGRTGRAKCWMAGFLSFIATFALAKFTGMSHLAFLFTFVTGGFAALIGFVSAPYALKLWNRRGRVYETIDGIDAGRIDPAKTAKATSAKLYDCLIKTIRSLSRRAQGAEPAEPITPPQTSEAAPAEAEAQIPEKELSPEQKIDGFTGKSE